MDAKTIMGKVIFINHDKDYATIEYTANGKTKTVNGNISEQEQQKLKAEKIIRKIHHYHVGDEVTFILTQSPRGDRMIADCIEFKFNNALDSLVNKSAIENRLVGYLKKVGDDYFVKETGSYIFFPLKLSPWEKRPSDAALNEPVFFKLNSKGDPAKATASLFKSTYIPEYLAAQKYFKNKTVLEAEVFKVTPHGIFVNVVGPKIQAKIPAIPGEVENNISSSNTRVGDKIKVVITYLSESKIIVEQWKALS